MPELPEVETIRRDMERDVVSRKVKSVEVKTMKAVKRHPNKKHFAAALEGAKVKGTARRGTYLLLTLDTGDVWVIHLGPTGQLRRNANKDKVEKHTHVIVQFTQGGQLRFSDPSSSSEMFVTSGETFDEDVPELAELGLDPVEEPVSWMTFGEMLMSRSTKLKPLLMDQKFLAGLGGIYSDEVLYASGLRHDRLSNELSTQEIRRLYRALVETLHDAVKYRGSSLEDGYVDLKGEPGTYQDHHEVYNREGLACRRCRSEIIKTRISNKNHFWCEQCQV